jgi:fumarate hydratase class II
VILATEDAAMSRPDRIEHDSLGEVAVPADALFGAQTQRAVLNFPLSGQRMPARFLRALGLVKQVAAEVNGELGELDAARAAAIAAAAGEIAAGRHLEHFPVDVFQTGSGTSTNMNANEVIATLASRALGAPVHPNDHVNRGQSSNDTIPTALHVFAALAVRDALLPALAGLHETIAARARELDGVVKTGRTHLVDALPIRLGQELGAWAHHVVLARERIEAALPRLLELAQGATGVGTGANAHRDFRARFAARLAERTGLAFRPSRNPFASLAVPDAALELHGALRGLAAALLKVTGDVRWMASGPRAGLAEIALPALQPGSSLMPGKVNPVVPEAVAMACIQVLGLDAALGIAAGSGSFQLHMAWPLFASNLDQSLTLLANGARLLAERALRGFTVDAARLAAQAERNPILATGLAPLLGYERAAAIAQRAYAEQRPVREVAAEMSDLDAATLDRLLDPRRLTDPHA